MTDIEALSASPGGPTVFANLDDFAKVVGQHLGFSGWRPLSQAHIDLFADATDDHQWIHTDPERAAEGPYGATIAHGFFVLALVASFLPTIYRVEGVGLRINYGCNKVRFPAPVKAGSRIRGGAELLRLERRDGGAAFATVRATVDVDGETKPACVAEIVSLVGPPPAQL